jgi:hypothetical protein
MSILYFTLEDVSSGLFDAQVVGYIKVLRARSPNINVKLLVLNRPWKFFDHRKKLKELKKLGIDVIYLPLLPVMRWYTLSPFVTNCYLAYISFIVQRFVSIEKFDLIHCRHYLPSMVITNLGFNNVLMDARSLHIQEYIQANRIEYNSKNYFYWLDRERQLLNTVKYVSVVSKAMITYYEKIVDRKIYYCPIIASFNDLEFCELSREIIRREVGWVDKSIFVYSGSFGLYGLNKEYLARLVRYIQNAHGDCKFMFLVSNPKSEVYDFMDYCGLTSDNVYTSNICNRELYKYLSAGDVGIHALPPQLDSATRLGTKIVEYWAAGLPVLINSNVGEAAVIVEEFELGSVINLDNLEINPDWSIVNFASSVESREKIRNSVIQIFDVNSVVSTYLNIYNTTLDRV